MAVLVICGNGMTRATIGGVMNSTIFRCLVDDINVCDSVIDDFVYSLVFTVLLAIPLNYFLGGEEQ
ncbi:DUF2534 family protein [Escherichia coli]